MSIALCPWFKRLLLGVTLLTAVVCGRPAQGQSPPSVRVGGVEITGIPEDWSHHYVVFSDPGAEQEAIQSGRYAEWQRIVNEPRYVMQQLKRNDRVQGPAAGDAEYRSWWLSHAIIPPTLLREPEESWPPQGLARHPSRPIREPNINTDWNRPAGGPGLKTGHYPAKFAFNPNIEATCSDFVIFPTGAASSTTQATILAFANLYSGCTGGGGAVPSYAWAYNTGASQIANTSPVLSLDGRQVAFIQTTNTTAGSTATASLVILKMGPPCTNNCGIISVTTPTASPNGASYRTCANGAGVCYITFSLGANDTNSAPFYRYDRSHMLYVGDDSGRLHTFTGVFGGVPAESSSAISVDQVVTTTPAPILTSPIYDSVSSLVFVTSSTTNSTNCTLRANVTTLTCGRLYSVNLNTRLSTRSSNLDCGTGFLDPPIVDSTTANVYAFIGSGCDLASSANNNIPGNSYINRFMAGSDFSVPGFGQNSVNFNNGLGTGSPPTGGTNTNSLATIGRAGSFDNMYFSNPTANGGNAYACVNGVIYQIPMSSLNGTGSTMFANIFARPGGAPSMSPQRPCSPLTEFQSIAGPDLLFVSVQPGTGSNSQVLNYNITNPPTTTPPLPVNAINLGLTVGPGTSGIIIDNGLTTGRQMIYFSSPSNAWQATQATLSQ